VCWEPSLKTRRSPDDVGHMASRVLNLRWPGVCVVCGSALPVGTRAWWDGAARAVTCAACREATTEPSAVEAEQSELDRGQAGASAAREYERRKRNREARTRKAHPRIGGLLLALRGTPQHETAFHSGELGEQAVAASLEQRTATETCKTLGARKECRCRRRPQLSALGY